MTSTAKRTWLTVLTAALVLAGTFGTSSAGLRFEAVYSSGPADVRVWLDRGYGDEYYDGGDAEDAWEYGDVYPSAADVVLYVRASHDCFTTVYVIDTEGFIHVIHPFSPFDDAYLVGGRVYRFYLRDYGFDHECFGRGVAFAFAVSSPVPFGYADYGVSVFGPHVGVQIYGDPFVAAKLFYLSILPPACARGFVGVSYARFYVTEYVRYPSYLCLGWHEHYGVRSHCAGQSGVHRQYRTHAKDPYRVLRPAGNIEREFVQYTKLNRTGAKDFSDVRMRTSNTVTERSQPITREKGTSLERRMKRSEDNTGVVSRERATLKRTAERVDRKELGRKVSADVRTVGAEPRKISADVKRSSDSTRPTPSVRPARPTERGDAVRTDRVVRSTKDAFVASKRNYVKMREVYEKSGDRGRSDPGKTPVNTKTTKVTERASNEARNSVALGGAPSKQKSSSGKSAKRTKL
jgi:hypothetical protein